MDRPSGHYKQHIYDCCRILFMFRTNTHLWLLEREGGKAVRSQVGNSSKRLRGLGWCGGREWAMCNGNQWEWIWSNSDTIWSRKISKEREWVPFEGRLTNGRIERRKACNWPRLRIFQAPNWCSSEDHALESYAIVLSTYLVSIIIFDVLYLHLFEKDLSQSIQFNFSVLSPSPSPPGFQWRLILSMCRSHLNYLCVHFLNSTDSSNVLFFHWLSFLGLLVAPFPTSSQLIKSLQVLQPAS